MPTYGASFRGVFGVYELDGNTCQASFVSHALPQLVERPVVVLAALPTSNPCPSLDAGQIFHSYTALGAFCGFDKGLANAVNGN
jgi:hypothetical protein